MNKLSTFKFQFFFLAFFAVAFSAFSQQLGDFDRSYNFGYGPGYNFKSGNGFSIKNDLRFYKTIALPNGKVLVTGNFVDYDGVKARGIVRLNNDGTYDESFVQNENLEIETVRKTLLNADGSFFLLGSFSFEQNRYNVLRFEANGRLDRAFALSQMNNEIQDIEKLSNGNIIIGYSNLANSNSRLGLYSSNGNFISLIPERFEFTSRYYSIFPQTNNALLIVQAGIAGNNCIKINASGMVDTSFKLKRFTHAMEVKILSDGKFYVLRPNGAPVKYNINGSIDSLSYTQFPVNFSVHSMVVMADNSFYLGHSTFSYQNNTYKMVSYFNANGSLRATTSNLDDISVNKFNLIHINRENKIFNFYPEQLHREVFHKFGFIGLDNTLRFDSELSYPKVGSNSFITSTVKLPDNSLLYVGCFTYFNRHRVNHIVKVKENGTVDTTFKLVGYDVNILYKVMYNSAIDKIYLFGAMKKIGEQNFNHQLLRLNLNGSIDTSFSPRFSAYWWESKFEQLQSGKFLVFIPGFSYYRFSKGMPLRINNDGSIDSSFKYVFNWYNQNTNKMKELPNRKILIFGKSVDFDSMKFSGLIRLQENGALDSTFRFSYPNLLEVNNVVQVSDNKLYLVATVKHPVDTFKKQIKLLSVNPNGSVNEGFGSFITPALETNTITHLVENGRYFYFLINKYQSRNSLFHTTIHKYDSSGTFIDSSILMNATSFNGYILDCVPLNAERMLLVGNFNECKGLQVLNSAVIQLGCNVPLSPRAPRIRVVQESSLSPMYVRAEVVNPIPNAHYSWSNGAVGTSVIASNADTIRVRMQVQGCLSAYSNRTIINSSEDDFLSSISLFPNPARDRIKVVVPKELCFEIYNIVGSKLQAGILLASEENELDISKLQRGVYIISFMDDNRRYAKKLVLE